MTPKEKRKLFIELKKFQKKLNLSNEDLLRAIFLFPLVWFLMPYIEEHSCCSCCHKKRS